MQCRWHIETKPSFAVLYKQCEKEATKMIKDFNGDERPFCDRHAKLEMTRSGKYKLGFTIRDISQKHL